MTATLNEETGELVEDETPEPEPETPDDDDDEAAADDEPEPEPEEETPHAGPVSDEEHAQVFDKAIKRAKTYMQAVPTILGDSATDLELCPRCTDLLPGFILPLTIKPVPLEQKVAVKLSIGELGEPQLKQADDAFTCAKCDGEGKVLTGSKIPTQATATCLECRGRGWVGTRVAKVENLPADQRASLAVVSPEEPEAKPVVDPWGRTLDDPLYGIMPGYERA